MSRSLLSALAAVSLLAVPVSARADDDAKKADKPNKCTISVKKGDLVAQGKDLIVEGDNAAHDAVAIDGDVVVRAGTTVHDVVALRGKVTIESGARVSGDVTALGGDVRIRKDATIEGDVSALGGRVKTDDGASIAGKKNQLSINFNGEELVRSVVGHLISGTGTTHCELRFSED
ncbi:polymer-forming cytoskeletal protein [Vitiosangium sp. GDMCC 1.1324]|uniref:polymer-forming cytoskeletal protein n=1 Tax=Vitiosangium sp. (strain GDMCC 1.1324) TaxID=2138576 RepID=UPI000D3A2142|nr:polymer-forming cytoskeletal protein [Vitiosangium sp. GDMCC 1.1324]PTL85662.1 hypothetical protein DAT35_02815 [Vitiosangium sp. GDMCC 1.1324]